jgi:hypothetical protein
MKVQVLQETGHDHAMLGLSLSFNANIGRMPARADALAKLDAASGESKFLEAVSVWLDVTAPRYWWQQFSTYRVGTSSSSESTMHTIMRWPLTEENFEGEIDDLILKLLNAMIERDQFDWVKKHLPESFLQRRIVTTNYKSLRHIYHQRKSHRLEEWTLFCNAVLEQIAHPHWITGGRRNGAA